MSSATRLSSSGTLASIASALLIAAGARGLRHALATDRVRRHAAPKQAAGPGEGGWWTILKRTYREVNEDRVLAVAGGVTFYGLLSLFPAITVLVSAYGLFADPAAISRHLAGLASVLPEAALQIIGEQVTRIAQADQSKLSLVAVAGLLVALWSATAATKAMMDALNVAYGIVERRSFVRLNLVSLGFTLAGIVGLIVMLAAIAAVPAILAFVDLGALGDLLLWAGRWPVILVVIGAGLALLYSYGPCRAGAALRWITPGSILASIGLLVFSMLFSWYAANVANYNATYGSLGAVIGFLTWMWLSSIIVLVGAELDAEVEAARQA